MIFNLRAYDKCKQLEEWGVPYKEVRTGIVICEKIMIAKNHSRWKKLGSFDWYPYYGLRTLIEALYDDCLEQYADKQQKSGRKFLSVPISHEWKHKQKPKEKNT